MSERSRARLVIVAGRVPLLSGARALADAGQLTGGYHRNRGHYGAIVPGARVSEDLDTTVAMLLYNPETSGGLLMAIAPENRDRFERACEERQVTAWEIGNVEAGEGVIARP